MDVIELLNKQHIVYTVSGQDFQIKCLNPDHDDRNPSLRVDKVTGVMHCFSCGFRGNIFSHFGTAPSAKEVRLHKVKTKVQAIRSENVGLRIPEASTRYVGAFRGISADTLAQFEAFTHFEKEYAGRLVFPIRDITGKVRVFLGRAMDTTIEPKYMIHPRGSKMPLFPSVPDIKEGTIVLVEGIFDALNLIDKGITNAVCCFGTNNMDIYKISLLKILGVKAIHIFFDGDIAGEQAAEKVADLCNEGGLQSNVVPIAKGTDPGDLTPERVNDLKEFLYG